MKPRLRVIVMVVTAVKSDVVDDCRLQSTAAINFLRTSNFSSAQTFWAHGSELTERSTVF